MPFQLCSRRFVGNDALVHICASSTTVISNRNTVPAIRDPNFLIFSAAQKREAADYMNAA